MQNPVYDYSQSSEENQEQSSSSKEKKTVQYQCSECDKSFTDGLMLISHLEDHGREEQQKKRNTCSKCGRVCSNQASLEKHMRVHGSGPAFPCPNDVFSCKFCSKSYPIKKSLSRHYKKWHHKDDSDSAPYFPCHVCGKTFSTSESLEDHQLCHVGVKPHECAECGKCFVQASQLQQHQRMNHVTFLKKFELMHSNEK
uniref:C2H2-type domain-containing protein n=1 Tax=Acanthochromis polyacanthus TaxID=80966 RepID=A0A3Q1F0Z8_9TELE